MNDENIQSEPVAETPVQVPEPAPASVGLELSQSNGSTSTDLPLEAPEAPMDALTPVPVEDQNGANQTENQVSEPSVFPAPPTSATTQTQSLAQQDQRGFIKSLLIKAQAKIQSNKQKKIDKLIELAQKNGTITNDDVQKLLRVSDATATRYLVKLVQEGRLTRIGSPRDAKYQFMR